MCQESGADRLARCKVDTHLRFIKNAVSVNRGTYSGRKFACTVSPQSHGLTVTHTLSVHGDCGSPDW